MSCLVVSYNNPERHNGEASDTISISVFEEEEFDRIVLPVRRARSSWSLRLLTLSCSTADEVIAAKAALSELTFAKESERLLRRLLKSILKLSKR
jgi:hypothetical protein